MQLVVRVRHVDHDHAFMHVHLRGREPDAGRGVHRLGHVGNELANAVIDGGNGFRHLVQPLVRVVEYFEQSHVSDYRRAPRRAKVGHSARLRMRSGMRKMCG